MKPLIIGVLLDVSGSMEQSTGEGTDTEDTEWARSIFTTIDNLIKNDLKPNNHIFAIGFGASREIDPSVFDLLGSLDRIYPESSLWDVVDSILGILETNGARNVRKWASKNTLMDALKGQENKCDRILRRLKWDESFTRYVVKDCLPSACRDCSEDNVDHYTKVVAAQAVAGVAGVAACSFIGAPLVFAGAALYPVYKLTSSSTDKYNLPSIVTKPLTGLANGMNSLGSSAVTNVVTATKKDIDDVVDKIEIKMNNDYVPPPLKGVSSRSVYKVRVAHKLLRGHVGDENELTKKRIDELMDKVRPCIYGGTPLYEALQESADLFEQSIYSDHKKLLFVLSDGQPADKDKALTFNTDDITTVSCFITSSDIDPYILFSSDTNTEAWVRDAQFMFDLSSAMQTQNLPRTIFVKRKWTVEMINNETKLFLQVNHPDHLKDACEFAREVATCQEALSEVLASVDLDVYINQSNDQFDPQKQVGPTCYANASAAVMHLAMNRILGRDGGVPDFTSLRDEMINCYRKQPGGEQGADTRIVLNEMCPRYRLRCEKVDKSRAMRAIMEKRPVVARFRLTKREWNRFGSFFAPRSARDEPDILTSDEIKIHSRKPNEKTSGHAVVLTSFNSKCLRFMNSWGTEWADGGFFNVQDPAVLDFEFFDIYWDEEDLTPDEISYFAAHGSEVADRLMKSLIGLQESTFECPLCIISSKVTVFKGRLSSVTCPECKGTFQCGTKGNILALNLYLTSLCCNGTTSTALGGGADN